MFLVHIARVTKRCKSPIWVEVSMNITGARSLNRSVSRSNCGVLRFKSQSYKEEPGKVCRYSSVISTIGGALTPMCFL